MNPHPYAVESASRMASWKRVVVVVCLVSLFSAWSSADSETVVNSAAERDTLTSQNRQQQKDTLLGYFASTGSAGKCVCMSLGEMHFYE